VGEAVKALVKSYMKDKTIVNAITEYLMYIRGGVVELSDVEKWLEGVYRVFVKPSRDTLTGAVSFDVYFERGGERFKLHTDLSDFRLSCESCGEAARGVLTAVASALGIEEPRWEGNALALPADVGWATFLKLWKRNNMSLPVEEGGRELLRVEVLEARADGTAKFRLWYYKWHETRPDKPYVDIEIKPYPRKDGGIRFKGYISANVAEGILREHLAEIAKLLEERGVKGVAYYEYKNGAFLQFTGAFRDSVLTRLGIEPELPPGEPPAVQYLGGLKFKIGDREVEFGPKAVGARRELYAELTFPSADEAERLARSLKAINVAAEVVGSEKAGYTVRLDSDAFFGLLAAANAAPPGLMPLYRSKEGDFRVYASTEEERMRFYFAVKHRNVWRVAEGVYSEKYIHLIRAEREVLEAIRNAVARALKELGRPTEVGEPKERVDERGNVEVYYLSLHGPHITPFLEHAAETVKAGPAEVRLEGKYIVISTGDVRAEVDFKLLKRSGTEFLLAKGVRETLALYKSLKEMGVRAEITPRGVKVDGEAMWGLVAMAVERGTPSGLPAEVMPGVELLKVYNVSDMKMYIFRAEGVHYYFVVKSKEGWRAVGGKYDGKKLRVYGDVVHAVADIIGSLYRERGVDRMVEIKLMKNGTPYISLTNVDLSLLGIR